MQAIYLHNPKYTLLRNKVNISKELKNQLKLLFIYLHSHLTGVYFFYPHCILKNMNNNQEKINSNPATENTLTPSQITNLNRDREELLRAKPMLEGQINKPGANPDDLISARKKLAFLQEELTRIENKIAEVDNKYSVEKEDEDPFSAAVARTSDGLTNARHDALRRRTA